MVACYFLHGSDYKCLLREMEPKMGCKHRLKNDRCKLVSDENNGGKK